MANIRYNPKVSRLFVAIVAIILGATSLSVIYTDIIYFNAGFTVVLVIITAWYATTLHNESTKSEKSRRGRFIAEIARSVFSAMHSDLERSKNELENGDYLRSLKPITFNAVVLQSPSHYLNDDITISPQNAQIGKDFYGGIQRPAPYLLNIPDVILQKEHLPVIQALCEDYDGNIPVLVSTVEDLCMKIAPIWQDFKAYCLSIDQYALQDFLPKKNPWNPGETYFCTLLRLVVSETAVSTVEYPEVTDDGEVRVSAKSDAFNTYYAANKDILLDWLEKNGLKENINKHKRIKQNLLTIISSLDKEINALFLAWKMEYYLTEDEMNIQQIRGI